MFLTFLSFVAYMHLCLGEGIFLEAVEEVVCTLWDAIYKWDGKWKVGWKCNSCMLHFVDILNFGFVITQMYRMIVHRLTTCPESA